MDEVGPGQLGQHRLQRRLVADQRFDAEDLADLDRLFPARGRSPVLVSPTTSARGRPGPTASPARAASPAATRGSAEDGRLVEQGGTRPAERVQRQLVQQLVRTMRRGLYAVKLRAGQRHQRGGEPVRGLPADTAGA